MQILTRYLASPVGLQVAVAAVPQAAAAIVDFGETVARTAVLKLAESAWAGECGAFVLVRRILTGVQPRAPIRTYPHPRPRPRPRPWSPSVPVAAGAVFAPGRGFVGVFGE